MESFMEYHWIKQVLESCEENVTEGLSSKQMFVQGKALKLLSGGHNEVVIILIKAFGKVWRDIINDFEERLHKLPSVDDLINGAKKITGKDPYKIAEMAKKRFGII